MSKKIYTETELQNIIDLYAQGDDTRDQAIAMGNQFLTDFAKGEADIEESAYIESDIFERILNIFGTEENGAGDDVINQLGAQALAQYEKNISELNNVSNAVDENRIYQLTSDQNQIKFDLVTLEIYREMGLVDASVDPSNMTPNEVAKLIDSINLTEEKHKEYSNKFIDTIIGDSELFELTPPKILTDAYIFAREQLQTNPNDKDFVKRFDTLARRIDSLITNFHAKINYFYSDPSNIADVWAGYRKMCDVRTADLRITEKDNEATKKYKQDIAEAAQETITQLQEIVSMYSYMWNLKDLKPEDAEKLEQRWKQISKSLKGIELTDELLFVLSNYKFLDEDGNPMPQFIDENGDPKLEFKPGYKLNPTGRLSRIISLAKNDVTMMNVGDLDKEINNISLTDALFDRVPWKIAEISVADQVIQGIEKNPHKLLTEEEVNDFWETIQHDGGSITDAGYQAALDAQVNQAAGFAGMMAQRIGNDKPIVMRPFDAVQDIDKLAATRSEKIGAGERKRKIGFFKRMAKNFGAAAVMSAGLTFIGKATGVAYAGAAVGTALGIGNMVVQGFKWRKEQKKAGKPHGLRAFFKDKRNWGPAIASGLGVAAVISMATGNPELAAGFGIGAMAVGGGSAAKMTYDDALNAGYTKGQALAGALGVAGATIVGGLCGRAAMNGVVNYVNTHTDSTLFQTEHTVTNVHETTQNTYPDGWIEGNEHTLAQWESPQMLDAHLNGLMDAGLSHDDAVRYLLAWHDVTDHNLGGGYFDSIGMSYSDVAALRGSIDGTMINLNPESMAAFNHFNDYISGSNTVRYPVGLFEPYNTPVSHVLPPNATWDANGMLVPGHDVYSTWVNWGGEGVQHIPVITTDVYSIFTPNELAFPAGIGTVGIYEPRVLPKDYLPRMRERAGALADRAEKVSGNTRNDGGHNNNDEHGNTNNNGNTGHTQPTETTNDENNGAVTQTGENTSGTNTENNSDTGSTGNGGTVTPTGTNSTNTENGANTGGNSPKQQRGFFGKMKDFTYKVLQTGYHGLQKIQKGVHNMKTEKIKAKHERELEDIKGKNREASERAKGIKAQKKAYDGISIDEIDELSLKDAAAIAGLNKRLKKRLGEKRLRLSAALDREDLKQRHDIQQKLNERLAELDKLAAELETFDAMGGEEAMEKRARMAELEAKVEKIETQAEIDLEVARAEGRNKVKDARADGRTSRLRKFGQALAALRHGRHDVTEDDIKSAANAIKLAKKELAAAKTNSAKKIWQEAADNLAKTMANHTYTEEQRTQIAEYIVAEAQRQMQNVK